MSTKTIEIFRVGSHTAMDGRTYTFSRDDLLATAAAYDPAVFSAPVVIGHPKTDDPAYGWATSLRVEGDVLLAEIDQVDPAFAEIVNAGRYKKVSPWFYPPEGRSNPAPGVYYPRHIGFLGAAAPGCQGLTPVAFAEGEDAGELIAFADQDAVRPTLWLARLIGRMIRRQRDALIEEKGLEEANKVIPEWEADAPADIVAELQKVLEDRTPGFSEPAAGCGSEAADAGAGAGQDGSGQVQADQALADRAQAEDATAELARREAAVAAREAELAERDAAFAAEQRRTRVAEDDAFLDGLVGEGRLPPGLKPQFAAFCEALGDVEGVAFSEGAEPENPRERFRALLASSLGKVIRFDEVAPGDGLRFAEGATAAELEDAIAREQAEADAAGRPISAAEAAARARRRR